MDDNTKTPHDTNNHFFREVEIQYLIHELKDPIAVIETGIRTLLEQRDRYGALSQRQERTLTRTLRNVRKAREMLYGLLEIGRSEAGCFCCRSFDPSAAVFQVLLDSVELMAVQISDQCHLYSDETEILHYLSNFGIILTIDPDVKSIKMYQDETKFRQIVGNLIKNAFHYRKDRVDIRMRCDKDSVIIEVSDDGPGIEPEHQELIFKRYSKAGNSVSNIERQGHGLGLSGSFIMAKHLGGFIELVSQKGKGATFKVVLPVHLPPASHSCKSKEVI